MNAVVHQCDSSGGEDIVFVPEKGGQCMEYEARSVVMPQCDHSVSYGVQVSQRDGVKKFISRIYQL
jgi:hypothetical protein